MTTKLLMRPRSAEQVSILLTIIALILWTYSLTQARLNIGFYGLINSFPTSFFIALGVLTIASAILWISNEKHQKLLFFQLFFLITALWLTPALIGSHPGFGVAYRNLGLVSSIVEQGQIIDTWYLSWPGAHLLFASLSQAGALNLEPIVGTFPFFMQLLWLLPLYIFLRNLLGKTRANYCWAGLWLFSLANWIGQEYFSPQAIAFFFLLLLLALITSPSLWQQGSRRLPFLLAGSFIIAAIVITHLLTALAASLILAAFCLARRDKKVVPLVALCLLLVVLWDITGGAHYISRFGSEPIVMAPSLDGVEQTPEGILVFDPGYIVQTNITMSLSGSESHIAVVETRIIFSSIFVVLGLTGAILALVLTKPKKTTISVLAMAVALLLLLPLAKQFGWELVHRLYLYGLPFMAYFGAMLLDLGRKKSAIILCFLLIAAGPLFIISHYGNQAKDYWPPSYIAGWHYVDDMKKNSGHPFAQLKQLSWQDNQLVFSDNFPEEEHHFAISQHDDATYDFLYNQPQFVDRVWNWLASSQDYDFIYANPQFSVFTRVE